MNERSDDDMDEYQKHSGIMHLVREAERAAELETETRRLHAQQVSEYWAGRDLPELPIWRPIETAPKDGASVLMSNGKWISIGFYTATGWGDDEPPGWYSDDSPSRAHPTHWMPLPAPPASQEGQP